MVEMARVEGEIVIYRPVEEVFDFVADERNEPRYNPRMLVAEQISEGPIGLGTRFRTDLETTGRTMSMIVEFTERPRRLASVTRSSMMETEGALTCLLPKRLSLTSVSVGSSQRLQALRTQAPPANMAMAAVPSSTSMSVPKPYRPG